MADLGTVLLWLAALLSVYAAVGSVAGVRLDSEQLITSARRAVYGATVTLALATGALVYAFLSHDFSIAYVYGNSNRATEPVYTWVAFYAGNEGSFLFKINPLAWWLWVSGPVFLLGAAIALRPVRRPSPVAAHEGALAPGVAQAGAH